MILSDKGIRNAQTEGSIAIAPFLEKQVQPASYDLRVGKQGATIRDKEIVDISSKGFLVLDAGDAGLLTTEEIISLDAAHAARFGLSSKYARKGVYATTGTQIDPGFRGRLFVGVTNLSPKPLTFAYKEDFLTLELHQLVEPCEKPYNGRYQDKTEFGAEDVEYLFSSEGFAFSDVIKSLQTLSAHVASLSTQMELTSKQMELVSRQIKFIMWAIGVGIAVIAIMVNL
ncbi:MAG: 2'-deoxycytidine 5'-triphosphate deaminase [Gammaproteobacteria bacterium]|nr:2'-deoxycytidine 5'-triphosphate deaminase [Gammaproteobacteria bacterium]